MSEIKPNKSRKIIRIVIYSLIFVFVLIQFIPVNRTNPPVKSEPKWDSDKTKQYAIRACYDCHSSKTKWPLYSHIAPLSWLIISHVEEGREELNFSEFKLGDGKEAAEVVEHDIMPLNSYVILHPDAKLTYKEKVEFVKGLVATFGRKVKKGDED
ncbi:MAG: heme-binding domain-containing protein [Bacteroidetes bacterium]|nr:heme-binding domain-containing protein [Bacteroidota bacterium]